VYEVLDLFSGIGGFSLGLERTGGFKTAAFCEIEEFPRRVLKKHWPDVPIYKDVRELNAQRLADDGIIPDVITGGFPCQDISVAGKQGGIEAERSGLWDELCRLIGDIRPRFAIVENVSNLLAGPSELRGGWFGKVLGDLAEIGFDAEWHCIHATSVGVPQRRPRAWVIAYPPRASSQPILHQNTLDASRYRAWLDGPSTKKADTNNQDSGTCAVSVLGNIIWSSIPYRERSGNNERLSFGLDRFKTLGNAVVPQIPEIIGRAILDVEIPKH
jgi:DNA (cytosine-5)-methyltransferase 1